MLRRNIKIKQSDLAKKLGVSPSYLCKVEKGRVEPSESFKKKCSEIFHREVQVIFSDSPPEKKGNTVLEVEKNLPNQLWSVRQQRNIKQQKLAELIGCSPSYLSKVEKGLQIPSETFMKKCAKVLKIKAAILFPES